MAIQNLNPYDNGKRINLRDILNKKAQHEEPQQVGMAIPQVELVDVRDVQKAAYQRPVDENRIRAMIRDWKPLWQGVPEVSRRRDGSFYVFDGQHRIIAISRMPDVDPRIPMLVWDGLTPEEESEKFSEPQDPKRRRPMLPEDLHNARVFRRAETSTRIDEIVTELGYRIGAGGEGRRIKAVKNLYDIEERYGADMLRSVLTFIVKTWGTNVAPEGPLMAGIAMFMAMFPDAKYSDLSRRVAKKPLEHWLVEADDRRHALKIKSKTEGVANTLHAEYNTTHHTNPLPDFTTALREHSAEIRSVAAKKVRARNAK